MARPRSSLTAKWSSAHSLWRRSSTSSKPSFSRLASPKEQAAIVEVSFAAAFIGGILSLLSPCSSLLLPAFFAYAFQSGRELTARTALFYLGLASVFVPLGMGASLATALFLDHRDTMIVVAGVLLIVFGVLELAGRSLSLGRVAGGGVEETRTLFGTYSLGLVYGFGGFCSGPILGSVLTVAATSDNPLHGGGLLATYALGTTVPLFLLAVLWDRAQIGRRRWLRGWGFRLGPFAIHSTNLIAGTIFIALGASFILLQGTLSLTSLYEDWGLTDVSFQADRWVKQVTSGLPDALTLAIIGIGAATAVWLVYRGLRSSSPGTTEITYSEAPSSKGDG